MRPLRLEMKGFGTFRDETQVDFSDAELVAFVGATGSGKSTIIDAITFALYGSVARYDNASLVAPIINQLSTEARVLLTFEVAGQIHTAVRVVRRTRNGATTKEARLERGDEVIAGSAREMAPAVEQLLGLDFGQFTKTVVLPQGRFAEFLHDTPADRQELLRQLLDLGMYTRMGVAARSRASVAANKAEALLEHLQRDDVVTPELVAELGLAASAAREAHEQVGALAADHTRLGTNLAAAVERRDQLAASLALLEPVVAPEGVAELGQRLSEWATAVADRRAALASARDDRRAAEQAVEAGPDGAAAQRLLEGHGRRDEAVAAVAELVAEAEATSAAVEDAQAAAEAARSEVDTAAAAVHEARQVQREVHAAVAEGPVADRLERILERHDELARVAGEVEALQGRMAKADAVLAEAQEKHASAAAAAGAAAARFDHLRVEAGAGALVASLQVGEPCPVCRQDVAELPSHDHDAELAQAEDRRTAAAKAAEVAADELRGAEVARATLAASVEQADARGTALERQLEHAPDPEALRAQLAEAERLAEARRRADAALTEAEEAAALVADAPRIQQALAAEAAAARTHQDVEARRTRAAAQVEALDAELADAADVATLQAAVAQAAALSETLGTARERELEAESQVTAAETELADAQRAETVARSEFSARRDALVGLEPPPADGGSVADDWQALASWASAASAERSAQHDEAVVAVRDAETAVDAARAAMATAAAPVLGNAAADGAEPAEVVTAMVRAEAQAAAAVVDAERQLAREGEVRAQADELTETAQVAGALGQLLRADGFERWLLEEVVADLLDRATGRLQELSGGQYSLVADDASFKVRDHRNADELRDARTLSGGETFLASLALALALADNIAELSADGAPRLESIFLDEGFGTLDPETLDVVASAVEELGAGGRMVGIVTHIRELASRMPVRFEVVKEPATSVVERVEG